MAGTSRASIRPLSLSSGSTVRAYRALQQTGVSRAHVGEHLNQRDAMGGLQLKSHGRQPDSGNPTVRDETGGLRKRGRYGRRTEAHREINGIATGPYDVARTALLSQPFGTGFAARRRGRKEQAVFLIHQRLVELEQCCQLDERAKLRNPARAHEQHGQSEYDAIERGQIRRPLPGSTTDQELMFEQKRLCGDGAHTTWVDQSRERDEQMDGEDEEFAHRGNRSMTVSARKTAPHRRI
jgi:hypothetical protein